MLHCMYFNGSALLPENAPRSAAAQRVSRMEQHFMKPGMDISHVDIGVVVSGAGNEDGLELI